MNAMKRSVATNRHRQTRSVRGGFADDRVLQLELFAFQTSQADGIGQRTLQLGGQAGIQPGMAGNQLVAMGIGHVARSLPFNARLALLYRLRETKCIMFRAPCPCKTR